jgi:hypothetical protein
VRHADTVAARGGIDICFNATSNDDVQGTPLLGMRFEDLPSYEEVASIAAFAASDWARTITASEINFTGGGVVD